MLSKNFQNRRSKEEVRGTFLKWLMNSKKNSYFVGSFLMLSPMQRKYAAKARVYLDIYYDLEIVRKRKGEMKWIKILPIS